MSTVIRRDCFLRGGSDSDGGDRARWRSRGNQREREKGRGLCLMKAGLSVYYKLKILPSLVCSRHEEEKAGGGVGCVRLSPQTQQL